MTLSLRRGGGTLLALATLSGCFGEGSPWIPAAQFLLGRQATLVPSDSPSGPSVAQTTAPTPALSPESIAPEAPDVLPLIRETGGTTWNGDVATPHFQGQVEGLEREDGRGLPGAWVATRDGRWATTDGTGQFVLPGLPPADGVYVAGAVGYVSTVVAGFPADERPLFHLQPLLQTAVNGTAAPRFQAAALTGSLRDAAGQPAAGVLLVLGGAGLALPAVAYSDAAGQFRLRAQLAQTGALRATLLASGPQGQALLTDIPLTGRDQAIDGAPADAGSTALRLTAPRHSLRLAVDPAGSALSVQAAIALVAPDGTRLSLSGLGPFALAPVPGLRLAFSGGVASSDGLVYSRFDRPEVPIDWNTAASTWNETLLAVPDVTAPDRLVPGASLAWQAVDGARGYTVDLAGDVPVAGLPLQGFTLETRFPLVLPRASLPKGSYRLG
ncbi:MAG: carboxypeptidase-like regulatory domain-containing protein, partial [Candidatus Sericytochromatia bacterium]|nr:carboxypeptidase-like regulatory domain-containing protein [Candidatus Sericytochromatia bacterium]